METENVQKGNTGSAPMGDQKPASAAPVHSRERSSFRGRTGGAGGGSRGGDRRGGGRSFDKVKPEFDQKIVSIRRVTRVVAGGRRMSFSVAMIIGNKKGAVGLGTGKAIDTALAINKAVKNARKHMIFVKTTKDKSIPYDISAKFSSSAVTIFPNRGKGLVAGSAARDILLFAGITNVTSKINTGSKNKLNNAKATMKALSQLATKKAPTPEAVVVAPKMPDETVSS